MVALPSIVLFATGDAVKTLASVRTQAAVARTALDTGVDDWSIHIEKTYGALAAELTRKGAERFFPRSSGGGSAPDEPPTPAST